MPWERTLNGPVNNDISFDHVADTAGVCTVVDEGFCEAWMMETEADWVHEHYSGQCILRIFAHVTDPAGAITMGGESGFHVSVRGEHSCECGYNRMGCEN